MQPGLSTETRFRHQGPRKKIEEIDIVPTDWLFLINDDSLQCKFLSSKYLEIPGKVQLLHDLVKKRGPVPDDWPSFPVKAIGRAHTYEEALKKLERLSAEENVFTDSEDGSNESEAALITQVKRRALRLQQEALKRKMEICSENEECSSHRFKCEDEATKEIDATLESPHKPQDETQKLNDDTSNVDKAKYNMPSSVNSDLQTQSQDSGMSGTETDASNLESSTSSHGVMNTNNPRISKSCTGLVSNGSDAQNIENLDVIDLSSIKCKNDYETAVIFYLSDLSSRMKNLEVSVENIAKKQREISKHHDFTEFCEKYNLDCPFKSLSEFTDFNTTLASSNKSLQRDLYNVFRGCLDAELSITKTFGKVLRKFISNDELLEFTAVKPKKNRTR
ncbi:hypothetical protein QAD02_009660 [Eretmocerus hayati]|uniref:Uncharacterized protein n=1 Tax=Eretmocerus hayati TaxID=131215 RepID=A0ACC2NA07_9HYME|nr:hypothetical protein QAD02_009660 [Eretmocerus hayati]